jgi:hypothetical protein
MPQPTVGPRATSTTAAPTASPATLVSTIKIEQRAVWDTTASPDALQGTCPNGSIVPPYGPVLITPSANGGFDWKDVQNATYAFTPTTDGAYRYNGPNGRADGVITMTVTFENATAFVMRADYVKSDTPGCTHQFDYKGVFKFAR